MQSSRWICRWDTTYNSPCECGDAHPPVLDVKEEQNNQGIRVVVHSHTLRDPYCICMNQIDHNYLSSYDFRLLILIFTVIIFHCTS